MKLRKLHIEDYKMFKDFDISFVDENDEALPIVILAGVNGSGKTTLLEKTFLSNESSMLYPKKRLNVYNIAMGIEEKKEFIQEKKDIVYFLSGLDNINKVSDEFVKTFYDFLKNHDYRPSEVKEHFHKYMIDIFDGIELTFKYSHLDKEDNVWFSNTESKEYYYTAKKNDNIEKRNLFTIDELSTGEKTLLSKILYLYFKDYKNKIILIDEPELSLHPSWQNKVLKIYENFAKQNNCQIIIATHSPHIIGSAKPEYIRLLKKENNKIVVIDNIDRSYGLEFDKILTGIMGVENLRTPDVAKDIRMLWEFLEDENYESEEYIKLYNDLESLLGSLDEDLLLARLEIAKIKSQNAQSK